MCNTVARRAAQMKLAVAVLALVSVFLGRHASGQATVNVCPNSGGSVDLVESVLGEDCVTLEQALGNISSDSTLVLQQGGHHIQEFKLVHGLHNVTIFGVNATDPKSVVITCAENVGLSFVNMTDLTIGGITIDGCGLSGENLVKSVGIVNEIILNFYDVPRSVKIGMFLGHCEHLMISQTIVANTTGVGVVGINIVGQSQLSDMQFLNNSQIGNCSQFIIGNSSTTAAELHRILEERYKTIGGGLYLLYEDYLPELQTLYSQPQHTLEISESIFFENTECSFAYNFEFNYMFSSGLRDFGHGIGGSGGLTLVVSQLHYGVNVTSTTVTFQNNMASYGSGTHVSIYSGVANTHLSFDNCTYIGNGVTTVTSIHDTFVVGCAGLSIISDIVRPYNISAPHFVHDRNVTVQIIDTLFKGNEAPLTGAISIYSLYTSAISDLSDVVSFLIERCIFEENVSFLASAIGVVELKFSGRNIGIQTVVRNSTFMNNTITNGDANVALPISQSAGTIDLQNVNFTLTGDCFFMFNEGTAIRAQQVTLGVQGSVMFKRNLGINGGALHLEEYTFLVLNNNSKLYFEENIGRIYGGAIFVNYLGVHSSPRLSGGYQDCFLLFDYDVAFSENAMDINSTGAYVEFNGNLAPLGSIVYGSSLSTCYWASDLRLQNPNLTVFEILDRDYPNIFNFSNMKPMGLKAVGTPARKVEIEKSQLDYTASPGEVFMLDISAFDNFNQNIPNVIQSYVSSDRPQVLENSTTQSFIGNNSFALLKGTTATMIPVRIFGNPPQNLTVIVYSTDNGGQATALITVDLINCSVGFIYVQPSCVCNPMFEAQGISCDVENHELLIPEPLWFGPIGSNDELAVHMCSTGLCKTEPKTLKVYPDPDQVDYDSQCAEGFNRGGLLCGTCRDNYSVSIGSRRCLQCSNSTAALIILFILLGILLVFSITFLQITITAGYINGGIFYANIISLYVVYLAPGNINYARYFFVYFVTLNFGIETCFYSGMTDLERVLWQLLFPLYLFILMFIIKCFAKLKWFNKGRTVGLSTIQAFATLSILCYVSVLESSVELLGGVTVTSISRNVSYTGWITDPTVRYFQNAHGFLAVVACLLIIFYIIPLPIFLLYPRLLYRAKYLRNLKPFYDAFYDPFEPSFRFWLGFRLMFRWIPFVLAFTTPPPINTFVTAFLITILLFVQLMVRPFKGMWRNLIDGIFLLALIFHFNGSILFTALLEIRGVEEAPALAAQLTHYTTAFYCLMYGMYFAIFCLHIYIRFPKLQQCLARCIRKKGTKQHRSTFSSTNYPTEEANEVSGSSYADIDRLDASLTINSSMPRPPAVYNASELREPLLDDFGSVEIVAVTANQSHIETRQTQGHSTRSIKTN